MKLIYSYTRKEAIEDGCQKLLDGDLGKLAQDAGYKWPVYVTNSVFNIVEKAIENETSDLLGVFWDILFMSRHMKENVSDFMIKFKVKINGRFQEFYMETGPIDIDDPNPCLTLMTEIDL